MNAFWQLSSTRSFAMGYGPIPWNMIVAYAKRERLSRDVTRLMEHVIREMDAAYLAWQTNEAKNRK